MRITFDIPFQCPDSVRPHLEKVFSGEYDTPGLEIMNPRILDLGANCRAFSLWALHLYPSAQIFAYEPHPKVFEILQRNTEGYRDRIKLYPFGVGTPGLRILRDGLFNCGESSFHQMYNNPVTAGQHIEVHDPLTLPEAEILKLDIEGCEYEVLEPLIRSGRRYALILLEYHNHELRRAIDSLLSDYELIGAEVHHIIGRGVMKYAHRSMLVEG